MADSGNRMNAKAMAAGKLTFILVGIAICLYFAIPQNQTINRFLNSDDTQDMFSQWKQMYQRSYKDQIEEQHRYQIFEKTLQFITKHNSDPTSTSTVGLNNFADRTREEMKTLKGLITSKRNLNMVHVQQVVEDNLNTGSAPASWDWRTKGAVTQVKSQGQCGCCWAFSATGVLEGLYFITYGKLVSFSEQQLVDCSTAFGNLGCEGGEMDWTYEYLIKYGTESEATYPYNGTQGKCHYNANDAIYTPTSSVNVTSMNSVALQTAVLQQPVTVSIDSSSQVFEYYTHGIISSSSCGTQLDFTALAVGYSSQNNQDYWIVKNQFGIGWGIDGYVYIAKSNSTSSAGVCGIAMAASYLA